jgi:hypothetical protein
VYGRAAGVSEAIRTRPKARTNGSAAITAPNNFNHNERRGVPQFDCAILFQEGIPGLFDDAHDENRTPSVAMASPPMNGWWIKQSGT